MVPSPPAAATVGKPSRTAARASRSISAPRRTTRRSKRPGWRSKARRRTSSPFAPSLRPEPALTMTRMSGSVRVVLAGRMERRPPFGGVGRGHRARRGAITARIGRIAAPARKSPGDRSAMARERRDDPDAGGGRAPAARSGRAPGGDGVGPDRQGGDRRSGDRRSGGRRIGRTVDCAPPCPPLAARVPGPAPASLRAASTFVGGPHPETDPHARPVPRAAGGTAPSSVGPRGAAARAADAVPGELGPPAPREKARPAVPGAPVGPWIAKTAAIGDGSRGRRRDAPAGSRGHGVTRTRRAPLRRTAPSFRR